MTCPVMEAPQQSSRLITNQVETPLSSTPTQQIKLIGDLSLAQVLIVLIFCVPYEHI